jgi:hypothetical protein
MDVPPCNRLFDALLTRPTAGRLTAAVEHLVLAVWAEAVWDWVAAWAGLGVVWGWEAVGAVGAEAEAAVETAAAAVAAAAAAAAAVVAGVA